MTFSFSYTYCSWGGIWVACGRASYCDSIMWHKGKYWDNIHADARMQSRLIHFVCALFQRKLTPQVVNSLRNSVRIKNMQSKMQRSEKCLQFKSGVSKGVSIFSGCNFLCQQNYISGCIISSGSQRDLICAEGHYITLSLLQSEGSISI